MTAKRRTAGGRSAHRLKAAALRWRCDPGAFAFTTTEELGRHPIEIIGQDRAQEALRLGLTVRADGFNVFAVGAVGSGRSTVTRRMLDEIDRGDASPDDLVFVHNFKDPDEPRKLSFAAGRGCAFQQAVHELVDCLNRDLLQLFDSEPYRKQRAQIVDAAGQDHKARLKEFEKRVQAEGFALVQVQMGPLVRPHLVPVVAGNAVDMDQLEAAVEEGQFDRTELIKLQRKASELRGELEALGKHVRNMDRELRRHLANHDRELARPLVEEAFGELADEFEADGLDEYLAELVEDLLEHLDDFRQAGEPGGDEPQQTRSEATRYRVNVVVDNSETKGRPIIWEGTPSYRNLFGTVEKSRTPSGEWETDHTRIKAGSLLRAHGGFLVLDAMDVLVEPGVWAALKRTLRHRKVTIQSFDPLFAMVGVSVKPEPVPIDVKVVMIGTRYIYQLLRSVDEDFSKIFKVKAELAMWTPRSEEELLNYARFVNKKVDDDALLPFHRDAVAAVAEHGVRLAGNQERLTTRFVDIADVVREASFWAGRKKARAVRATHVQQAVEQRVYRVNLTEEVLRERIVEGLVLIDLDGAKVGQVNGLALLDQGDHVFCQPSRITATTALGRAGVIDLEREAEMSGSIHTKGVLILTGFLRERFAQDKPLALTATLCFEQNYGGVDGDSASSAELYALLSSLSGVPLRQGIAVTGSVNQRGEIQPIGGVNEKVEGFFDLCRVIGLDGEQGVMIPSRNLPHLMLRKDLVAAVRKGRFHVWAVETIEQGLEVLTGERAGERQADGSYEPDTVLARADERLARLAEQVAQFGPADVPLTPR